MCDRASTITHVDREKKNSAYQNNKIFYYFLGVIDSVAFCYIFIHFPISSNYMALNLKFIYFTNIYFCEIEKHTGSFLSSSTADPDLGGFPQGWGVKCLYRVVHFADRHACVTFWTHSRPATGNSKPETPYQPACVRSVTSGLRSVRLCTESASWC